MTTRLASHARRWDVSAGTRGPFSRTEWPARRSRIDAVVERRLGEQAQRVGLLLRYGRRLPGNAARRFYGNVFVYQVGVCVLDARPLTRRLTRRGERPTQHRAHLGLQPAADDHHAVFILIHVESPARVALGALHGLCVPIDPAPAADDAL